MVARDEQWIDPTPEEIRARCEEIRKTWSEDKHFTRAGFKRKRGGRWCSWNVPEINMKDVDVSQADDTPSDN